MQIESANQGRESNLINGRGFYFSERVINYVSSFTIKPLVTGFNEIWNLFVCIALVNQLHKDDILKLFYSWLFFDCVGMNCQ